MRVDQVEILSDATNAAVMRHPGRRFSGLLLRGDTLYSLHQRGDFRTTWKGFGRHTCWETDGDTFTMSWSERDGPSVSAPKRRGFGTMVIEGMAKQSVDGAVELDYAPSGLTWRLNCPATNALEPADFPVEGKPN